MRCRAGKCIAMNGQEQRNTTVTISHIAACLQFLTVSSVGCIYIHIAGAGHNHPGTGTCQQILHLFGNGKGNVLFLNPRRANGTAVAAAMTGINHNGLALDSWYRRTTIVSIVLEQFQNDACRLFLPPFSRDSGNAVIIFRWSIDKIYGNLKIFSYLTDSYLRSKFILQGNEAFYLASFRIR